jgi:hypothetical protein
MVQFKVWDSKWNVWVTRPFSLEIIVGQSDIRGGSFCYSLILAQLRQNLDNFGRLIFVVTATDYRSGGCYSETKKLLAVSYQLLGIRY